MIRDARVIERDVGNAWGAYRRARSSAEVEQTHERWAKLVEELYKVARDRSTRQWLLKRQ